MIFSPFERMVALRYLRPRRREGAVSVIAGFSFLGIALGVATLIVVLSVMNGFRAELLARFQGVGAHATVTAPTGSLSGYLAVAERLKAVPGVVSVMPTVEGQALVNARGRATGARVRGLSVEDFSRRPVVARSLRAGLPELTDDGVMIDIALARALGVGVGGEIALTSPRGTPTPFGTILKRRSFTVLAIVDARLPDRGPPGLYMKLETAQSFFRLSEAVTGVDLFISEPESIQQARPGLEAAIGAGLRLTDWRQMNSGYVTALAVERVTMFIVLSLIILVASFNVVSSMVMLVRAKAGAIAILRSMGAERGAILRIFLLAGGTVGVVGTGTGFAIGVALTANVRAIGHFFSGLAPASPLASFLSDLPALIDWSEVLLVVATGLLLSVGATLYPALKAARMEPVEALRHG